jgi:hypothetical protein
MIAAVMLPERVYACPVCFGASDSLMARGLNMGIFVLLGITVVVLGAFATFFLYLMRRAKLAELTPAMPSSGGAVSTSRGSLEEPV